MVAEHVSPDDYLDALRACETLAEAEQWAAQHPLMDLYPHDPIWTYGLLGSTALANPEGLCERCVAWLEHKRSQWAGPLRRVADEREPLYFPSVLTVAARREARRPWWLRWWKR